MTVTTDPLDRIDRICSRLLAYHDVVLQVVASVATNPQPSTQEGAKQ